MSELSSNEKTQKLTEQAVTMQEQQTEINTLHDQLAATKFDLPMLKLSRHILLVPLVGAIDSVKAQKVMEDILVNIRAQEVRVALIDIAGIKVVDSSVAAHLIRIAKAARLMGCKYFISGISPLIATNIVNHGFDISDIGTTNTLEDAILQAYGVVGLELRAVK